MLNNNLQQLELASKVVDLHVDQIDKLSSHIHLNQKIYICEIVGEEIDRIESLIQEVLSSVTIH